MRNRKMRRRPQERRLGLSILHRFRLAAVHGSQPARKLKARPDIRFRYIVSILSILFSIPRLVTKISLARIWFKC